MHPRYPATLSLEADELAILAELIESERARLLVEIRHTHHRTFRDELRERLTTVEKMAARFAVAAAGPEDAMRG